MRDELIGALAGAVRMGLVVAALVVAFVPIGRSALQGFCPGEADASGADVVAAMAGVTPLAQVVEPSAQAPVDPDATAPEGEDPAAPGSEAPDEDVVVDEGPCGAGVARCLPPLISAVLQFGDADCGDEALSRLRSSMLPAFVISSALLVGAWALRPRQGAPILSRW